MSTILRTASFCVAAALVAACGRDAVEQKLVGSWQTAVASPAGAYELHFTAQANGLYRTDVPGAAPGSPEIGIFKATSGRWRLERSSGGVEEGTYEFVSDDSVLFKSKTGVVLWTRVSTSSGTGALSAALLETGPFGPATEGSAAVIPAPAGAASGAPSAAGVPNAAGLPNATGFAAPALLPTQPAQTTVQSAPNQPATAAQPPPTMTTKQAVAHAKATMQQTASQTAATARAGAQQIESQAATSATDAVDSAAAETNKKVGQKIGSFASNAGSKIKNFFTGGKRHDADSGSADGSAQPQDTH